MAASGYPAFGERCRPASRRTACQAAPGEAFLLNAAAARSNSADKREADASDIRHALALYRIADAILLAVLGVLALSLIALA